MACESTSTFTVNLVPYKGYYIQYKKKTEFNSSELDYFNVIVRRIDHGKSEIPRLGWSDMPIVELTCKLCRMLSALLYDVSEVIRMHAHLGTEYHVEYTSVQ